MKLSSFIKINPCRLGSGLFASYAEGRGYRNGYREISIFKNGVTL